MVPSLVASSFMSLRRHARQLRYVMERFRELTAAGDHLPIMYSLSGWGIDDSWGSPPIVVSLRRALGRETGAVFAAGLATLRGRLGREPTA